MMKIGILSDTHNEHHYTQQALATFRRRGVDTLFHCGDLAAPDMVKHFAGFETYFARGNMDRHQKHAIHAAIDALPGAHWLGKGDEVTLAGKRIALTHGDKAEVLETLLFAEPDYLFCGHTHRRRDERIGPTRVVNPGALGGTRHEARSVAILDLERDVLEVVYV